MILRAAAARLSVCLRTVIGRNLLRSPQSDFSPSQTRLLHALLRGDTLKSHRYLDGGKEYRLHPLNDEAVGVPPQDVRLLEDRGLLLSNQKFPAATLIPVRKGAPCGCHSYEVSRNASNSRGFQPLNLSRKVRDN